jgi:hypothetical protein
MYNNKLKFLAVLLAVFTLTLNACKKDELPEVEEEELITTITLTFTNTANSADVRTITWRDLDGDGGNAPVITPLSLRSGATYNVAVTSVLNETENPAEDIKEEVEEENDEHLFVYRATGANITFSNFDVDANNLPVGLTARATTGAASTGTFTIILRHQPGGIKNGTETPGSTDLEAVFPANITTN